MPQTLTGLSSSFSTTVDVPVNGDLMDVTVAGGIVDLSQTLINNDSFLNQQGFPALLGNKPVITCLDGVDIVIGPISFTGGPSKKYFNTTATLTLASNLISTETLVLGSWYNIYVGTNSAGTSPNFYITSVYPQGQSPYHPTNAHDLFLGSFWVNGDGTIQKFTKMGNKVSIIDEYELDGRARVASLTAGTDTSRHSISMPTGSLPPGVISGITTATFDVGLDSTYSDNPLSITYYASGSINNSAGQIFYLTNNAGTFVGGSVGIQIPIISGSFQYLWSAATNVTASANFYIRGYEE